eukprot:403351137
MENQSFNHPTQPSEAWVFCYGSNHPEQLSRRIETTIPDILSRSVSCTLLNYTRVYQAISRRWEGSVASIVKLDGEECQGFAIKMTGEEILKIDVFESYPEWYLREPVELQMHGKDSQEPQIITGLAYIMNPQKEFKQPSDAYLTACSHTLSTHHFLKGNLINNVTPLKIDIINGINMENSGAFEFIASTDFMQIQEESQQILME